MTRPIRNVREEDGVELVVAGFKPVDHVDIRPVPKLVARLELDIEVNSDPSLDSVFRQVHLVSHAGCSSSGR